MSYIPCAGVVIFDDDYNTILVKSKEAGNLSFPKGKRNKGETDIQTALREMNEETGLTADDIVLVDDFHIDEMSNNGHPSVRYFLAKIKTKTTKFTFDEDELQDVDWYTVEKALKTDKLKNSRKAVLSSMYDKIVG